MGTDIKIAIVCFLFGLMEGYILTDWRAGKKQAKAKKQ